MEKDLKNYVIYDNPSDFPGKFVLREFNIGPGSVAPGDLVATGDTIEEVRQYVPEGCVQLPVYDDDDPVISEVWM